jgi:phosphatidylglycerol:prolipoprotein diacylglycerol transferase
LIDPIAFRIGPIAIYWYGIIISLAVLIGFFLAISEAKREKIDPNHILDMLIIAMPTAIIFARLYYVVFNLEYYRNHPREIFATWQGGLAIHGVILGGLLVALIYTRVKKIDPYKFIDIFAPSLILGQAIGRWGNFINQEAYGYEVDRTKVPWAMYIDGAYRHPTFLYESLWNIGVFVFLMWYRTRKKADGEVFLYYMVLYSIGRFIVEAFRTDSLMLGPIRVAQLISIIFILVSATLIYLNRKRSESKIEAN